MWVLTTHLNDTHNVTKWQTQEGAIVDRERQLQPRRERVSRRESPTGYITIWPSGWTSITTERGR